VKKTSAITELKKSNLSVSIALEVIHYRIMQGMFNRSPELLLLERKLVFSKTTY